MKPTDPATHRATHRGLTADMFVLRDDKFLTLTRTSELGRGLEYLPGGGVEPGEDPRDAAIRETSEETGLRVVDVSLLRAWTWSTPEGWDTVHATFVGYAPIGDPVLSDEHSAFQWTTPIDYIKSWCPDEIERAMPAYASWFRQCRETIQQLDSWMADRR